MTTTVNHNNFSVEGGCKTFRKPYENDSVDGERFHCGCVFLYLPGLVWTGPETQSQSRLRRIGKETKTTTTPTTAGQTSITTDACPAYLIF